MCRRSVVPNRMARWNQLTSIAHFYPNVLQSAGYRSKGGDRHTNFYALTYWETDGAMLVQLSIEKVFLIFLASGPIKEEQLIKKKVVWNQLYRQSPSLMECKIQWSKHIRICTTTHTSISHRSDACLSLWCAS